MSGLLTPDRRSPDERYRRAAWRGFVTAVRLGWKVEANWTDPLLFFIYSVAKPVAGALILVVMVDVISGGRADPGLRAFVVIGTALWSFVTTGIAGLSVSILEDRERYRVLKYLYVSPNSLLVLMLGRGTARIGIAAFGAVITLAFGVVFLGVPFDVTRIDWPLLALAMAFGLLGVLALAVVLAAIIMQTRQDSWNYPEAVAGGLFLLVGAVFPLGVLPPVVQFLGLLAPLTWWLEGTRAALFPGIVSGIGGVGSAYTALTGAPAPATAHIVVALAVTTAAALALALAVYGWSERRARERGLFDLLTGS